MNPLRKLLLGGAVGIAALTGGAIGAGFVGTAGAQTTTAAPATTVATVASTVATPSTTATDNGTDRDSDNDTDNDGHRGHGGGDGGHQANGITEAVLTGDTLTKATAAAQAAVPGGTVERAETDAEGAAYEVHMTKADGSDVTVKLDANFAVSRTVNGHG